MITLALRLGLGVPLLYAGFTKAMAPVMEFAAVIDAYKILPSSLIPLLALLLPYVEMGIGLYLITGFMTRWSAAVTAGLFGIFLAALASTKLRGIDLVSCGCFGAMTLSPAKTMMIDGVLLSLALVLAVLSKSPHRWSLDGWLSSGSDPNVRKGV